jgi:hypothetical protein
MSRQLLPPPGGDAFGIAAPQNGAFTRNDAGLLQRLGAGIHVREAATEGRVPSPVSRAFTFYANLFQRALLDDGVVGGDGAPDGVVPEMAGRQRLKDEARRTFRGMLTVFALREVLGLQITPGSINLNQASDTVSRVLVPSLNAVPGGAAFWNPVRLYLIAEGDGRPEVFAGRSPLTGFFPSAKAPRGLTGLYWYVAPRQDDAGSWSRPVWYDPTGDEFGTVDEPVHVSSQAKLKVRQFMRAWLDKVLQVVGHGMLQQHGLQPLDEADLLRELHIWRQELDLVPTYQGADLQIEQVSIFPVAEELPLFAFTVQASAEHVLSDLPEHNRRLIVTARDLRDPNTRLFGRVFGRTAFTESVTQRLPAYGDNLGEALGLHERAIARPYVLIDRLFTRFLTPITTGALSQEWDALEVDMGGVTQQALLPFHPGILELVDRDTLLNSVSAKLDANDDFVAVRLRFGGRDIPVLYSLHGEGPHVFDTEEAGGMGRDTVDLRFFPDFDLDAVRHLLPEDVGADTHYYARLRRMPCWSFTVEPFSQDSTGTIIEGVGQARTTGTTLPASPKVLAPGEATFYTFDQKPRGFYFTERGFCLLTLKRVLTDTNPDRWEVGVDFGTSNTCVSVKKAASPQPEILDFPIMTTTLLAEPTYDVTEGNVSEGASAVLDFFYRYSNLESQLKRHEYFPTQLFTQQARVERDDAFNLRNGLIHFDNVSSADPRIWELVRPYPARPRRDVGRAPAKRFQSINDIKWRDVDWLRVFMYHLRKQVVLTAARAHASVDRVHFSYPKAFDMNRKLKFEADLKKVWGDMFPGAGNGSGLVSESEAVRDYVVAGANEYVVFDVGGGTSDIIAFTKGVPVFQTSFRLAAGQVNRYVAASPAFREAFLKALEGVASRQVVHNELAKDFRKFPVLDDSREDYVVVTQVWLSLLEQLSQGGDGQQLAHVLATLRDEAETGDAVYGFFLTVGLLFTGLAYHAGDVMRIASKGRFGARFTPHQVSLRLTGNGSRLYNMLSVVQAPFETSIVRMFQHGFGDNNLLVPFKGIESYNGQEAPKVTVALGLLTQNEHVGDAAHIPVANVVGEEGLSHPDGSPVSAEMDLVSYYQEVNANPLAFKPPTGTLPRLQSFLQALDEVLPYGRNGGFAVVPGAREDWCRRLATDIYKQAVPAINTRVMENARRAAALQGLPQDERPALEPLFIVELSAMLDAIRKEYGETSGGS